MSLLCLELCPPGELSAETVGFTMFMGVGCSDRLSVGLVGIGIVFALGEDMAALALVNLGGLGTVFGPGEDMAALVLVNLGELGTVFVVSVVCLALVVRWPCKWLLLQMAFVLGLAFKLFLVGKFSLGLGGGRPAVVLVFAPGEDMAALALVNLVGVRGGCCLAAAIVAAFCFFC